jgi:glutathione S-transferase
VTLVLYGHPFSSYTQKVLIALYETATPFTWHVLDGPEAFDEMGRLWPMRMMPVLADDGVPVIESSIVIEHVAPQFVPSLEVRFLDRFFDNYVMAPMQKVVTNQLRPEGDRDPYGVAEATKRLEVSYAWLEAALKGRKWAAGEEFTLADCAAAPALFYADWVHEIGVEFTELRAYRRRLLRRPSFARAVDEARPFRRFFPLGAPDRD